jgi:hypothetical protein
MELNESVAFSVLSTSGDDCPLEPHKKEDKNIIKAKRQKGDKSVVRLRNSMKKGRSTRAWKQNGDSFSNAENFDAEKYPIPNVKKNSIHIAEKMYPLSIAAHHLIPGKGSLKESLIAQWLWKSENMIHSDVGYDVDGSENGIWLPTHQKMSRDMGKAQRIKIHDDYISEDDINDDESPQPIRGLSWAELSARAKEKEGNEQKYTELFLPRYTQQAMKKIGAQFHDSHSNYNTWVKDRLDNINGMIETKVFKMCDKCKEVQKGKKSPSYLLVYRLNLLSNLCRSLLTGWPRTAWLTVYTSDFAKRYQRAPVD